MHRFIARHREHIAGVLSGFDRLVFRGTLRWLSYVDGFKRYLSARHVLMKDFSSHAQEVTTAVKEASLSEAQATGRPVIYLDSSRTDKEVVARRILDQDRIEEGLLTVITCVEPCWTFDIHRANGRLEVVARRRKCLHLYHYFVDPIFGFMNARIQTWFPFSVQVCLNGREWLARQMDRTGIAYRRRDNCFVWLEDVSAAQADMGAQLRTDWAQRLDDVAQRLNPAHERIFDGAPTGYYWSVYQSEWATDVMFQDTATLSRIYPAVVRHGITSFSSTDVMRFLGRRVRTDFGGEIVSDFKDRPEGVRIKHRLDQNSIKAYDKQGSILRVETTINDPGGFRAFRRREGDTNGRKSWRPLRKGIADLHRRAEISQAANSRYLDALADVDTTATWKDLVSAVTQPATLQGRRVRALRPCGSPDLKLLQAVGRGEFQIAGFRNRDLQALLYNARPADLAEARRRSARIGRLLRLLRAHGLIRKVPRTHRYTVTPTGRATIAATLMVQHLTLAQLGRAA